MALAEPLHTLAERFLRAGRDEQDACSFERAVAERGGEPDQRPDRAQVVVGPGHDRSHPDVSHRRGRRAGERDAGGKQAAGAEDRAGADHHRPDPDRVEQREAASRARMQPRRELERDPRQDRVEDQARVGRIVVGDQHERPLGVGIADLRDHVPRRPVGQHRAAEPAPAVAEVIPQGGRADAGNARGERAGQQCAPRAAQRERAARGRDRVDEADRPPVAAVGALLLDRHPAAERAQPLSDQLGAAPLAVGGRRAVERRELADRRLPVVGVVRIRGHRSSCSLA